MTSRSDLWELLKKYYASGRLTLVARSPHHPLSEDIGKLLQNNKLFSNKTLIFEAKPNQIDKKPDQVTFKNSYKLPFQKLPLKATLMFFRDDKEIVQLRLSLTLDEVKWKFYHDFECLKDTLFSTLSFYEACYEVSSCTITNPDGSEVVSGLNFVGQVNLLKGPYGAIGWLWFEKKLDRLPFSGMILLPESTPSNPPTISLKSPLVETGLELGEVKFVASVCAMCSPKPTTDENSTDGKPDIHMLLNAPIVYDNGKKQLDLSADLSNIKSGILELIAGENPDTASMDEFNELAGGHALASLVPSQFPLGDKLKLSSFKVSLGTDIRIVIGLSISISLEGISWPLVPGLVTLEKITSTFIVISPTGPSRPSFGVQLQGQFIINDGTHDATFYLVTSLRPTVSFYGLLKPTDTIDLMGVIHHIFPAVLHNPRGVLVIKEWNFCVDPSNKTYQSNLTVGSDHGWELPLGITIKELSGSFARYATGTSIMLAANVKFMDVDWIIRANRSGDSGAWIFGGGLDPTQQISIGQLADKLLPESWGLKVPSPICDFIVNRLYGQMNTQDKTFSFSAGFDWNIEITKELQLSFAAAIDITSSKSAEQTEYSGTLQGSLKIGLLDMLAVYDFQPDSKELYFLFEDIRTTYVKNEKDPYIRVLFGDKSLGDIISDLIGIGDPGNKTQLSAPWDILNAIKLTGLIIEIHFKTKEYRIAYRLNKGFGFMHIDTLGVRFRQLYGKGKIDLILTGQLLNQEFGDSNPLTWDPVNDQPPAVPGAGAASFDLLYLGLGQHIGFRDVKNITRIKQAIKTLMDAAKPMANESENPISQLPGIQFSAGSNWCIGMQFTLKQTMVFSIVFNDPDIYGLNITIGGAGNFAGLDFEIIYRKITNDIGLYHAELTLPRAMRKIEMGAVSITIPFIGIDIYTNGNFRIDMGFPASLTDYSNCFAIELFPFIGFGGFYFALLNGKTSTNLPVVDNGNFNTSIEFGIALSVGLGKTISLGIMSGGAYITVTGIVVGVFSTFVPEDRSLPTSDYYHLEGTIAIVGRIYATVDFVLIKGSVDLTVYAAVMITMECYEPILIEMEASVRVSVSIKVLFVRIHFHFSATVRESFSIGSASAPPWHIAGGKQDVQQLAAQIKRPLYHPAMHYHRRLAMLSPLNSHGPLILHAVSLGQKLKLTAWATPTITKALSIDLDLPKTLDPNTDEQDVVAISMMLYIQTAANPDAANPDQLYNSENANDIDTFEMLLQRLLHWVIVSIGKSSEDVISSDELEHILSELQKEDVLKTYFRYQNLSEFLKENVMINLTARPTSGDPVSGACFPMIPDFILEAPGWKYNFGQDRVMNDEYSEMLNRYFDQLAVDFRQGIAQEKEQGPSVGGDVGQSAPAVDPQAPNDKAIATYLFSRFFLMESRAVVQSAIDIMRNYPYSITNPKEDTLQHIAEQFPSQTYTYNYRNGDTIESLSRTFGVSPKVLRLNNLHIDFNGLRAGDDIPLTIAVTPEAIVRANASLTGLLRLWPAPLSADACTDQPTQPVLTGVKYQVRQGDTLGGDDRQTSISARFSIKCKDLVEQNNKTLGLFAWGAKVVIGDLVYSSRKGETLQSIAKYFFQSVETLINNDQTIKLEADQKIILPNNEPDPYKTETNDTLNKIAEKTKTNAAALIKLNQAIRVEHEGANSITLKSVEYAAKGAPFIVEYTLGPQETLDSLISRFFPDAKPEEKEDLEALLRKWNPTASFGKPGELIKWPYDETFRNLQIYFAVTLETLLSKENLMNDHLLAPLAILSIPTIKIEVSEETTFAGIASRYNISLEDLARDLADTPFLFRDAAPKQPVVVTVPLVPAMNISSLLSALMESGDLSQVATMASRFLLSGLRVPYWDDPQLAAACADSNVRPKSFADIQTYPLFALAGQEFKAPAIDEKQLLPITLTNAGDAPWVPLPPDNQISVPFSSGEIDQIKDFSTTTLDAGLEVTRLKMAAYQPSRQALKNKLHWQAADVPDELKPSSDSQVSGEPTLWPLPDRLQDSINASPNPSTPFELMFGRLMSNGSLSGETLKSYVWSTLVDLDVQQITDTRGQETSVDDLYLLNGADDDGKKRLLDLWQAVKDGDSVKLYLLLPSDPAGNNSAGYISDKLDRKACLLLKTNLSTVSHAAKKSFELAMERTDDVYAASLADEDSADFLQLLWQCSVTRSGGFYLRYRTSNGQGLPAEIFSSADSIKISLLAILDSQSNPKTSLVRGFNNMVTIGENIDESSGTLFVQSRVHQTAADDTLTQIAKQYAQLKLNSAELAHLNADINGLLAINAEIRVPKKSAHNDAIVYTVKQDDTFGKIAAKYSVSVKDLGTENRTSKIFAPDRLMCIAPDQLDLKSTHPAGTSGFTATRPNPWFETAADRALAHADANKELQALFNLIGYHLNANDFFKKSPEGLPANPAQSDHDENNGLSRRVFTDEDDRTWVYQQSLRANTSAAVNPMIDCDVLPPAKDNPYAGVSKDAEIAIAIDLQDVFGNKTAAPLSNPTINAPFGYTDEIINLSQWPSTSRIYAFAHAEDSPLLSLTLAFNPTPYTPAAGVPYVTTNNAASNDLARFTLVHYQLQMPDMKVSLATTMGHINLDADGEALLLQILRDYVSSCCVYLNAIAAAPACSYTTSATSPADTLETIAAAYSCQPGQLAEANSDMAADDLFGSPNSLTIPEYYIVKSGDSLDIIARRVAEADQLDDVEDLIKKIAINNKTYALQNGRVINAKVRSYPLDTEHSVTLQTISDNQRCAIAGSHTIVGLADANASKGKLTKDLTLKLETSNYNTKENDTLKIVANHFRDKEGIEESDPTFVALSNALIPGLFAGGQSLSLPNYIVHENDTMLSISETIGPQTAANGGEDAQVAQLALDNRSVQDIFPTGTPLLIRTKKIPIPPDLSVAQVADRNGLSAEELGAWNAHLPLCPNKSLNIPNLLDTSQIHYGTFLTTTDDTFDGIAAAYSDWTVEQLAKLNLNIPALFDIDKPIVLGTTSVTPKLSDTFKSLAHATGLTVDQFAGKVAKMSVVRAGALIFTPVPQSRAGDTIREAATRFRTTVGELAAANASSPGLPDEGQAVEFGPLSLKTGPRETFGKLADKFNEMLIAQKQPASCTPAAVAVSNVNLKLVTTKLFSPVRRRQFEAEVSTEYDAAIKRVKSELVLTRSKDLVDPALVTSDPVYQSSTELSPTPFDENDENETGTAGLSMHRFAELFEKAFTGFKLASGEDRGVSSNDQQRVCGQDLSTNIRVASDSPTKPHRHLWAVNFGDKGDQNARLNYVIDRKHPSFFALAPLSNELWNQNKVSVPKYVSGQTITDNEIINVQNGDVDAWARRFFQTLDSALSPASAEQLALIDMADGKTQDRGMLHALLDLKNSFAEVVSKGMTNILSDDLNGNPQQAIEALKQQMLEFSSAAASEDIFVQYGFDVKSGCHNPLTAARLSGIPFSRTPRTADSPAKVGLDEIAQVLGINAGYLAGVLANQRYLVSDELLVSYKGDTYMTNNSTTILTIAEYFKIRPAELAGPDFKVESGTKGLFRNGTSLNLSVIKRTANPDDTATKLAWQMDSNILTLMEANQDCKNFFHPGSEVIIGDQHVSVEQGMTPGEVAAKFSPPFDMQTFAEKLMSIDLQGGGSYHLGKTETTVIRILPEFTFAVGKLPLANGRQTVTFPLTVREIADASSIFLSIDYRINSLEYDITRNIASFGEYEQSSWLTFIIPLSDSNDGVNTNSGLIGDVQIPTPYRRQPEPALVTAQSATAQTKGSGQFDFAQWMYKFNTSRRSAAQDISKLEVTFNVGPNSKNLCTAAPGRLALFKALACYYHIADNLDSDLSLLSIPNLAGEKLEIAKAATQNFIDTIAEGIRDTWRDIYLADQVPAVPPDKIKFDLRMLASDSNPGNYQYMTLKATGGDPQFIFSTDPKYADSLNQGNIDDELRDDFRKKGFTLSTMAVVKKDVGREKWLIVDDEAGETYALSLSRPSDRDETLLLVKRKYLWPQLKDEKGQTIKGRQTGSSMIYPYNGAVDDPVVLFYSFHHLGIVREQNGWGGQSVTRNVELIHGRDTSNEFIYKTSTTHFPDIVTPGIVTNEEISLNNFAPNSSDTLEGALSEFFKQLFLSQAIIQSSSSRRIGLSSWYQFVLNEMSSACRQLNDHSQESAAHRPLYAGPPLTLLPEYNFNVSMDWKMDQDPPRFITRLVNKLEERALASGVSFDSGRVVFELIVYSTLSDESNSEAISPPLLKATNLVYDF